MLASLLSEGPREHIPCTSTIRLPYHTPPTLPFRNVCSSVNHHRRASCVFISVGVGSRPAHTPHWQKGLFSPAAWDKLRTFCGGGAIVERRAVGLHHQSALPGLSRSPTTPLAAAQQPDNTHIMFSLQPPGCCSVNSASSASRTRVADGAALASPHARGGWSALQPTAHGESHRASE